MDKQNFLVVLIMLCCLAVVSCGGSGNSYSTDEGAPKPAAPDGVLDSTPSTSDALGLIAPVDALAVISDRTTSALLLERIGSDYEAGLASLVTDEGASARFSPQWENNSSGFDNLASAIYSFNMLGFSGIVEEVTFEWGEEPLDYENLWVGFSQWDKNTWDWHSGPESNVLNLGGVGYEKYTHTVSGAIFVAVVLLGNDSALLDSLTIGESAQGDWW